MTWYRNHSVLFSSSLIFLFFDSQILLLLLCCSWWLAGYTMCCRIYRYNYKKIGEDGNEWCWTYGKALPFFSSWSMVMEWDPGHIICYCIILPYSFRNQCANVSAFPSCSHCARVRHWFQVRSSYVYTLKVFFSFSNVSLAFWFVFLGCHQIWRKFFIPSFVAPYLLI